MKLRFIVSIILILFLLSIVNAEIKENKIDKIKYLEYSPPILNIMGTDYQVGESGKIFVHASQNGESINDASCYLTVYYPDNSLFIDNQYMFFLEHGLYYYNFIVPNVLGIYMLHANCFYFKENYPYYPADSLEPMNITLINGTNYIGSVFNLYSFDDSLHDSISSVSNKVIVNYFFNSSQINNISNPIFIWRGQSNNILTMKLAYLNWSNNQYIYFNKNITIPETASSSITPSSLDLFISQELPQEAINNMTQLKIRLNYSRTSVFVVFSNYVMIHSQLQINNSNFILNGGGELHITDNLNILLNNSNQQQGDIMEMAYFILFIFTTIFFIFNDARARQFFLGLINFILYLFLSVTFYSLGINALGILCTIFTLTSFIKSIQYFSENRQFT